ncbi:MAG TPA: (2Fe-2S)-binding protein [Alphaproteobacteria bacterium]|nr:(2Fe-2S)-binding protein [Alphaproteobacteria bacterium]
MLVCQCNVITDRAIREVILAFLREDPYAIIVPAKVYKALGQRCKCAGCVPNVIELITSVTEQYHEEHAALPASPPAAKRRALATRRKLPGVRHERRNAGHRAA